MLPGALPTRSGVDASAGSALLRSFAFKRFPRDFSTTQLSFCFSSFFFFLLRCLLCAFAAVSQLGPALILLIFKLGDALPCLDSPPLPCSCPIPVCLSVCRPGPCVLRFIFTLKRTRAETYKWQPLARMDPSFPESPPLCYLCLFLSPSSIIISLGSSPF